MKRIVLGFIAALTLSLMPLGALGGTAYACTATGNSSRDQVINGIGETGGDCSGSAVPHIISGGVNILGILIGVAGIVMVILGGFKYITSGGESGKVANAKNTLVYALIGLIIAALAQFLVHFVLNQANLATTPCPAGQTRNTNGVCH